MSRILVTGGTGFVGANLIRSLVEISQNEVFLLTRKQSNFWRIKDIFSKINVCEVDILDKVALNKALQTIKPEVVYHFLTYGGYPTQKDEEIILKTNILGTLNLMNNLVDNHNIKRFVNIGSSSEYGTRNDPMREVDAPRPTTMYGIAKTSQTFLANYFYSTKNLPTVTLRFFSVYGPYEEKGRLISDIMSGIVNERSISLSSPLPRRDFVHAEDVVQACLKASETSGIEGEVFNIGLGQDYSIGEVVNSIEKILGKKLNIKWGVEEKKRVFNSANKWIADIEKAKNIMKWEPKHSLEKGLEKTYLWYSKNKNLYE